MNKSASLLKNMFVKKCCIRNCKSSASRPEDVGVTFHKFPKDVVLHKSWVLVTKHKNSVVIPAYVCSRHFCKNDFQVYQDSKYVLKTDSIPSIFPWTINNIDNKNMEMETSINEDNNANASSGSKDTEENVDAIREFMEQQDKEIEERKQKSRDNDNLDLVETKSDIIHQDQPIVIATSVLNMILSESATKIDTKKEIKPLPKPSAATGDKGSVALSVGSKVEARNYDDTWYQAEILEVDCDEMEVLVHYDSVVNKHDEWISVSSSRLRPVGISSESPPNPPGQSTPVSRTIEPNIIKEEMPDDKDKPKPTYVVGERCLARWRDNRRFVATISSDLGNGSYEIIFDDGFKWKCTATRLYKLKSSMKVTDSLSIDTSVYPSTSTPSPILAGVGPSSAASPAPTNDFPYHTHLFDPTRDYLSSKTERREMKRKLNIKEIFNIGQKKRKKSLTPREKTVRIVRERKKKGGYRRKIKQETDDVVVKTEIPEAVASIIGTVNQSDYMKGNTEKKTTNNIGEKEGTKKGAITDSKKGAENSNIPEHDSSDLSDTQVTDSNVSVETASEEEVKLVKFEKPDEVKHEKVIDKIKEAIHKLEGGLTEVKNINSPKPEVKEEVRLEETTKEENFKNEVVKYKAVKEEIDIKENVKEIVQDKVITAEIVKDKTVTDDVKYNVLEDIIKEEIPIPTSKDIKHETGDKPKKKLSKLKKSKKLRLLQEKKVKKQVEKVKNELQEMKRQFEEMRQEMLKKTEELAAKPKNQEMPESFLLPGEWCCKWVNGHPVGTVSELETGPQLDANNKPGLPRRSVQVEDRRLPEGWTKHMVRRSLGQSAGKWDVVLVGPDNRRFHTKTDMRNFLETQGAALMEYEHALLDFGVHLKLARRMGWYKSTGEETPPPTGVINSMSPLVKRKSFSVKKTARKEKRRLKLSTSSIKKDVADASDKSLDTTESNTDMSFDNMNTDSGCVFVGSLKVQVIDNLLRCPAEGCYKSFRNNTLIKMHIKYYHRDLRKMLGATPKVLDLAYARTKPTGKEAKRRNAMSKTIKVKLPKLAKRLEEPKKPEQPVVPVEPMEPVKPKPERLIPRSLDSPKLRQVLANKPVKRPKVLLPVKRPDPVEKETIVEFDNVKISIPEIPTAVLDFEAAITPHTVTKPEDGRNKKRMRSEEDDWFGMTSDFDTRSSCPGSGTPDSKTMDRQEVTDQALYESNVERKAADMYMYTESGERVKIERMKREEIINCHCGYREEDGLMVQCELCLCWQHALCHNIHREAEVPEKYTCSICLNPRRGRRSRRFVHDQDRMYEGLLPGARASEPLRRSHELTGNLLRLRDALHALRVKYYVATKKNHPKLYLWAKDWENAEITMTQEKLNSEYSDLNIIINNIGKENLPVKPDDIKDLHLDLRQLPDEDHMADLSSPLGTSLDLPISTLDLERLAKTVQEQESPRMGMMIPQPEAAIEGGACRERLLRHVTRCQALVDARLDSIEAQVAELESQDPLFEDDETADYFPRTKQTIQMLLRDLDTMEELGIIT